MRKHGPTPDNKPNPWFAKIRARRRRREKIAKKSRQVNYKKESR